jgi:hypothetical protein
LICGASFPVNQKLPSGDKMVKGGKYASCTDQQVDPVGNARAKNKRAKASQNDSQTAENCAGNNNGSSHGNGNDNNNKAMALDSNNYK